MQGCAYCGNWNLEVLVLVEGGTSETRRKTLGANTRTYNNLNSHMTPGRDLNPGLIGGNTLTTASSVLPANVMLTVRSSVDIRLTG